MLELPWLMGLQLFDRGKTKKKGWVFSKNSLYWNAAKDLHLLEVELIS